MHDLGTTVLATPRSTKRMVTFAQRRVAAKGKMKQSTTDDELLEACKKLGLPRYRGSLAGVPWPSVGAVGGQQATPIPPRRLGFLSKKFSISPVISSSRKTVLCFRPAHFGSCRGCGHGGSWDIRGTPNLVFRSRLIHDGLCCCKF